MAQKPVGNRSSEGVVAIRHPRTDFPQMGWLTTASVPLYDATTGFGWFAQTATWVTPKHPARDLNRWGKADANFDVINFSTFDPATQDWHIDSARTSQRLGRFLRDTNTDVAWINQNLPVVFDPAIQDWHIDSARTAKKLGTFIRETGLDNAWMGDLARLSAWGIPADRTRPGLRYQRDTNTDVSWIFPTLPAFDPATYPWAIQSDRTRRRPSSYLHWRTTPTGAGAPAEFDPTTFSWTQATARAATVPRYRRDTNTDVSWIFPNLPAFDPAIQDWTQQTTRTARGKQPRPDTNTDVSWIFPNLPVVFDPSTYSWAIQSGQTARRPSSALLRSTGPAGFGVPISFDLVIPSDRMAPGHRYRRDTNTDVAWIYQNLPVVFDAANFNWTQQTERSKGGKAYRRDTNTDVSWIFPNLPAFDPTTYPWAVPSDRTARRPSSYLHWRTTPTGAGVPDQFDPAIQSWHIQSDTYQSRAWYSDSPRPDAWLVPSAVFDPALWPGTTIASHRRWNKLTGRWQPDLDNAWIQTSVPVNPPFDATTQFAAIGIPGTRTPARARLQVARYQWFYDLSFVHDVIPLTDTVVPPATINYQGDGKKRKTKRKRNETYALFDEIESTIRTSIAGPVTVEAEAHPQIGEPVVDLSLGYGHALDRLLETAGEYQELSRRVQRLQADITAYEHRKQRERDEDDDEWLYLS